MRYLIGINAVEVLPSGASVVYLVKVCGVHIGLPVWAQRLLIAQFRCRGDSADHVPIRVERDHLAEPDIARAGDVDRPAGQVVVDGDVVPLQNVCMALRKLGELICGAAVGVGDPVAADADTLIDHQMRDRAAAYVKLDALGAVFHVHKAFGRGGVAELPERDKRVQQRDDRHYNGVDTAELMARLVGIGKRAASQIGQRKEKQRQKQYGQYR